MPWQVSTLEELQCVAHENVTAGVSDTYVQTSDINATPTVDWANGDGFMRIGDESPGYFNGTYDGQNHTISSLFIDRPELFVGLFEFVDSSATITNLSVTDANVTGGTSLGGKVGIVSGVGSNACVLGNYSLRGITYR
ncbi:MAG: hypothetical protein U5K37_08810 [Natrialbaceae archaeon]|nr:hypothetical protein [Natrialbaceae archaeon]